MFNQNPQKMKVNVQSVNFKADQKLVNFIQNKLSKLDNHFDKVIHANVYLKVHNTSGPENKITEVLLKVPGDDLVVKKSSKKFEEGVGEVVSTLRRQLKKHKEKTSASA